jgi:hypothetical protein
VQNECHPYLPAAPVRQAPFAAIPNFGTRFLVNIIKMIILVDTVADLVQFRSWLYRYRDMN